MLSIEEIVEKIKNGEERKDSLYESIKTFLEFQEKKYIGYVRNGELERGDIKTLVWLGVERAIETFCGEKNCKFLTWATNCIKYVVMNEYNKTKNREVSFEIISDGGEELSMEEIISDFSAETAFEEAETKIDGRKALSALKELTADERKIVILTYIKNIPPSKVAEGMGISTGRARTLRLSALKKLKTAVLR